MQVTRIEGYNARCVAKGVERDVSLLLLQDENLKVGDHVLIHVGNAIRKISAEEAQLSWELFEQVLAGY